MAETATIEKTEAAAEGGSSKKMLLVGLFVGVAVVAAYFLLFAKPAAVEDPAAAEAAAAAAAAATPAEGDVFEVATLTVNLDTPELRYARVQFGVVTNAAMEAVDPLPRMPLLQDMAIDTIADFSPAELRTVAGHQRLRDALTEDAQVVWPDGEILRVIFYDLIVQ